MNIERLYPVWFVLCAVAGAVIGGMTGHGAVRGLTNGMVIAVLPIFLLILAYLFMRLWRPALPTCRCRRCNEKGYRYAGQTDTLQAGGSVRFRCPQCGRLYELSRGRFSEVADDGRMVPYMHHTKWGRWKETKAEPTPAGGTAQRAASED